MNDEGKTKTQFIDELVGMRQRITALESDRTRAEAALHQKTAFVHLLQMVAVAANEASTIQDALQYAVDQVCAHTGWPVGDVYLRAEASQLELVPTGIWHLKNPKQFETFQRVTDATSFARGVGLPGRVLATGKPAWIIDVTKDPNFPRAKLAKDIGVKAGFGFPVLVGTEVVAVLEFFSAEAIEPDKPLLDIMGHIGTQLGRVIERTRAEAALQRAKDDLELRVQERTVELLAANVEIQETRQYLERLIESSTTAIISTNKEGNVVLFNEGAEAMLGYREKEIIGRRVTELYESEDGAKEVMRLMRKHGGTVSAFETILRAKNGTPIPVMISASILHDAEGQEAGTVGFNKDLRERKRAEEALLATNVELGETRQYLEGLIESSTDAIISTDKEGNVVLFNEGAEAMLGFQREEIIGQHVTLVYESVERARELMRLMRKQGGTVSAFETILRAKNGTPIPAMISASILYDEQGQEAGTVGFNKDLRPLKQAEEELRRAKAQIQALRIEIDQTKRARRVSEITETDYFQDLEKKVGELRDRSTPEPA